MAKGQRSEQRALALSCPQSSFGKGPERPWVSGTFSAQVNNTSAHWSDKSGSLAGNDRVRQPRNLDAQNLQPRQPDLQQPGDTQHRQGLPTGAYLEKLRGEVKDHFILVPPPKSGMHAFEGQGNADYEKKYMNLRTSMHQNKLLILAFHVHVGHEAGWWGPETLLPFKERSVCSRRRHQSRGRTSGAVPRTRRGVTGPGGEPREQGKPGNAWKCLNGDAQAAIVLNGSSQLVPNVNNIYNRGKRRGNHSLQDVII